ncbi:MAG TPA: rhodanese-like domain-containing protein [Bacteroidia bacterium]|nr:rhodanese-like domain-containing protein [Bacteroidia bacterium]
MKRTFEIFVFWMVFSLGTAMAQTTSLTPKQFKQKCEAVHGVMIDVRTPEEYIEATIPGAINVNEMATDFKLKIQKLDKAKTYFLFCGTGMRSAEAVAEMKKAGFLKVFDLEGGMTSWERDSLPVD